MATVKMEPVSEHGGDRPEPEMELSSIMPALSSPSAFDLVEIIEANSSTLSVRLIPTPDFQFLEVVPLKTPFLRIASMVAAPAIPKSSVTVLPKQSLPAFLALPSIEIDSQDKFIEELVDGFYNNLKRYLPMIFKSTCTFFASGKVIFSRAIENIREVGGVTGAESLKK